VCPSLETKKGEGQHSLAVERMGGANSDDWRESLALCLLCEYQYVAVGVDICETAIKFSLKRNCFRFEDKKFCFSWIGSFKRERITVTCKIQQIKKQEMPRRCLIEAKNTEKN
jgi:hypothetical protein